MKAISYLLLFFSCSFQSEVQAQTPSANRADSISVTTILGFKYHYGTILAHSSAIRDVSNSNPSILELAFSRLNSSDKSWQKCNCYSKWGAAFYYVNFANAEVLGNAYNLVFFFEPILVQGRSIEVTGKAGMGVGYVTKVFDSQENPENLFFSTRIGFPLLLSLNFNYLFNPHWNLTLSGYYNHTSNGGIKQPNLGINYPTLALGVNHTINPVALPKRTSASQAEHYDLQKYLGLFGTSKSINDSTEVKQGRRPVIGIQTGILKRFGKIFGFNAGVEAVYDGSFQEKRRRNEEFEPFILALMLGNNLIFGNFHFSQQFGIYFDPPTPTSKPVFQRYALDYFILPRLKAGFSLKAHGHVAENLDLRIGLVFD